MPVQATEAAKAWHCEVCNKRIAEVRGFGTIVKCRGCGHLNEA